LAVWGLAFKARTDDIRESAALNCVKRFIEQGIKVRAYDPEAMPATQQVLGDEISLAEDAYSLLDGCDALVILTDWQEFRSPDFAGIAGRLTQPVIFDGRNLYDPKYVAKQGIRYYCVGRPAPQ
jgi:UDPglucose 6-dehydrogenase